MHDFIRLVLIKHENTFRKWDSRQTLPGLNLGLQMQLGCMGHIFDFIQ